MKVLFKSFLVWCLLLAVPLQGYASATTLLCAPLNTASAAMALPHAPAPVHDHQAMLLAGHADHMQPAATSGKASSGHDAGDQCDACSACCLGAAMAASHAMRLPVEAQQLNFIPLDALFAPAVDLALPERPPQTSLT